MEIKDINGNIKGRIEYRGNVREAKDRHGNMLGKYDKGSNRTTDRYGNTLAYGDILSSLIK